MMEICENKFFLKSKKHLTSQTLQLLVLHRAQEPVPPLKRHIAGPARQPRFSFAHVRNTNGAKMFKKAIVKLDLYCLLKD